MKLYTDIFQRSWQITKTHPMLWVFGLFTLLWGGKSIDLELFFTNVDVIGSEVSPLNPSFWDASKWVGVTDSLGVSQPAVWLALFIAVVSLALVLAAIIVSQIGLVDAFAKEEMTSTAKTPADEYHFADALHAARTHGMSVLAVNLIGRGISYGLLALAALPLFLDGIVRGQAIYTWLLLIIVTPISIAISMITKYAVNNIVIDGNSAGLAIAHGWMILRANIGVSIEMAVVMLFSFAIVNVLAILAVLIVSLPILMMGLLLWYWAGVAIAINLLYYFVAFGGVIAIIFSAMLFSTWHFGNWTLLY